MEAQTHMIDIFDNKILVYLNEFCEEQQIDDLKKESQSVWNSCLRYIYRHVFKNDKSILKQTNTIYNTNSDILSNYNSYDYDKVLEVLDIYIYDMCMRYDKEVSIIGFSALTGIDESTIYDWGNGATKLSTASADVYKKLCKYREESLSNKLVTGNKNPVGVIAVLNRQFGWASPYTSDSNRQKIPLSAQELPRLDGASGNLVITEKSELS